jgi:carbamoyl-phosphate synthase small subunit
VGYDWNGSLWALGHRLQADGAAKYHVVAFDYGVKHNILRNLAERGCKVTVLPAQATSKEALALKPDGVFLSNGPAIRSRATTRSGPFARSSTAARRPSASASGHQLLGLASGAKTVKMKFGHHGANHPVQDLESKRVLHHEPEPRLRGRREDAARRTCARRTSRSSTARCRASSAPTRPAFSFQGHPEASPGPREMTYLFDKFVSMMEKKKP